MWRAGVFFIALFLGACTVAGEPELHEGNRLAAQGSLAEAAEQYRLAAQKQPSRARPRELLGSVLHAASETDAARTAWLEAVQLQPNDSADAQLGLARIDSERGDHATALDRLDRLLERQPRRADARLQRAVVALRMSNVERALEDSDVALKALPRDSDALYTRGTALLAAGKPDEARKVFERLPAGSLLKAWGQARVAAAQSRSTDVIVHLREARAASDGGWDEARVRNDPAFKYLLDNAEFSREFF
jgi:tetratricopeptide (TPR) repeat protein